MKFKYGDEVDVISGFYKGMSGFVEDIYESRKYKDKYYVDMGGKKLCTPSDWIYENCLEKR